MRVMKDGSLLRWPSQQKEYSAMLSAKRLQVRVEGPAVSSHMEQL